MVLLGTAGRLSFVALCNELKPGEGSSRVKRSGRSVSPALPLI